MLERIAVKLSKSIQFNFNYYQVTPSKVFEWLVMISDANKRINLLQ